jgi:hypothetical protein
MQEDDEHIARLVKKVRESGYERPNVEFVNPEIRTVSYAAPSLYGRFVFNLDKAVEAFDRGELLRSDEALLATQTPPAALEVVMMWRALEAWHALNPRQKEAYWANVANAAQQSLREGARQSTLFHARATSGWDFVSVWTHPNHQTLDMQLQRLRQLDFFKYFDLDVISGLSIAAPETGTQSQAPSGDQGKGP